MTRKMSTPVQLAARQRLRDRQRAEAVALEELLRAESGLADRQARLAQTVEHAERAVAEQLAIVEAATAALVQLRGVDGTAVVLDRVKVPHAGRNSA